MNDNAFGTVLFFAGSYLMMAFDFVLNNIGFLFSMTILLILGSYCGLRWIIDKRHIEKDVVEN